MKNLTELFDAILVDCSHHCSAIDVEKDIVYSHCRAESEGISFYTITLGNYLKDFDRSLSDGFISSDRFAGFKRRGGLPTFLSGFLRRVFSTNGSLLDCPDISCIRAVRQLCSAFKKLELECTSSRKSAAIEKYVATDYELGLINLPLNQSLIDSFTYLFGPLLNHLDDSISSGQLSGRHGPGAVFEGLVGNEKFEFDYYTPELDSVLPWHENVVHRFSCDPVPFIDEEQVPPVRVTLVPKTQDAPRVIAIEPVMRQYAQQALWSAIRDFQGSLPNNEIVGYHDQHVNRDLAREGSIHGNLCTIDLSEASDRVHNDLVEYLTCSWPNLFDFISAARSSKSLLPDGREINLNKFASMGSALCFPIEAMVFSTIIYDRMKRSFSDRATARAIRVFGDDIIVPNEWYDSVVDSLTGFGLVVNANKSFNKGKFRESCGGDYFDGHDVSPVRLRSTLLISTEHISREANYVAFQNSLYLNGYFGASQLMIDMAPRVLKHGLCKLNPFNATDSRDLSFGLYWATDTISVDLRLCPESQVLQARTLTVSSPNYEFQLDGGRALSKCLQGDWSDPATGRDHLVRYGRGRVVTMKRVWARIPHGIL